jgi:hypothetical protein
MEKFACLTVNSTVAFQNDGLEYNCIEEPLRM